MTRHVTPETRAKIEEWEGVILYAYDDATGKRVGTGDHIGGTITIGAGHTGPDVKPGMTITRERADALLMQDLATAERAVETSVTVPLSDPQFGTLVSFAFNAGIAAFKSSTLLKKLNAGKYSDVPAELMKWTKTHINGKLVSSQGLVSRRSKEAAYWSTGTVATPPAVAQQGAIAVKDAPSWVTPESISTATGVVTAAGAVATGNGPFQYALAAVLVIAVLVGAYFFISKRLAPK